MLDENNKARIHALRDRLMTGTATARGPVCAPEEIADVASAIDTSDLEPGDMARLLEYIVGAHKASRNGEPRVAGQALLHAILVADGEW